MAVSPPVVDPDSERTVNIGKRRQKPAWWVWLSVASFLAVTFWITLFDCYFLSALLDDHPSAERLIVLVVIVLSPLMYLSPVMELHARLEVLMDVSVRLEGAALTYRWRGDQRTACVLDGTAHVEVIAPEGTARSPDSIVGYRFQQGGRAFVLHQEDGFDHDDLVRIWPHVLAAARRYGTMVGPEMGRIAAGEEVATVSPASRDRPHGRAP